MGEDGRDWLYGGDDRDKLHGGLGGDVLRGQNGDDLIGGGEGNDFIEGGSGDDVIDAGSGNDRLFGDEFDDVLIGGTGSDFLTGGTGSDTFWFVEDNSVDIVYDFSRGEDHLHLTTSLTVAQILADAVVADGGSTILILENDTIVALIGTVGFSADWLV